MNSYKSIEILLRDDLQILASVAYFAKTIEDIVEIFSCIFYVFPLLCNYSSKHIDIDYNGLVDKNDNGCSHGSEWDDDSDNSDGDDGSNGDGDIDDDDNNDDNDDNDGDGDDGDVDNDDDDVDGDDNDNDDNYNKIENNIDNVVDCDANIVRFPWR